MTSDKPNSPVDGDVPEHGSALEWGGEIGGLILVAASIIFMIGGLQLGLGSPFRLGTGAFPFITGLILFVLAVAICLQEWRAGGLEEAPDWLSLGAIVASLAVFASTADRLGLVPAVFLTILVASSPDRSLSLMGKVVLGAAVALACWGLFITLLNLPLKAFAGI
ncbi:Tripartite tricarboxylate transporter TctB family protein [Jannaschia faecimaris]|uniref:Tripartite tricarboxylate transporter TctB family protein n=1 Tax=Jannaschia faecimaris TaxID=1244108 RepID=A0A1H3S6T4_9RHOB|nr:tripartite tricarboxylate transporter TctB family protein [Jannaschia faecimaris]SDZ32869.1 Tripartite tricarboxylate transporter TctB family protein [Jannaschia faecimaris]